MSSLHPSRKAVELLAPAGNYEKLKIALHYGADAVYAGLSSLSLRAQTGQFTADELKRWIDTVHAWNRRIYVTMNIYAHNRDLDDVADHASLLSEFRPDGIIVADPGVFDIVAERAPRIPIHVSTQANVTNRASARFWERLGAQRIVLARELSLEEIREIRDSVDLELEAFVHGAICIAYSGRCYISSYMTGRSGNRGECTNSCRWNYHLMEETRPGEYFPVYEDERGTHIMSSKDLCMLDHLGELRRAGVDSFKIEGRMKGINYAAGVVKVYREAIDTLEAMGTADASSASGATARAGSEETEQKAFAERREGWLQEISLFSNRGFTTGMYFGKQPDDGYNFDGPVSIKSEYELAGVIERVDEERGAALVALRNTLRPGDRIRFLTPGLEEQDCELSWMEDLQGARKEIGKNGEQAYLPVVPGVREMDLVRVKRAFVPLETEGNRTDVETRGGAEGSETKGRSLLPGRSS